MIRSTISFPFAASMLALLTLSLASSVVCQSTQRLTSNSGPGARHPVVALDADVIAYVAMTGSGAGGSRELFVVATDGSAPVQLTTGADVHVRSSTFDLWAPISISDNGNFVAYWNAQGVHVLDRQNNTDIVVATTSLLASPRLDGDGSRLVYQEPVNGDLEVFLRDSAGTNPAVQLTSNSGPGRRLPFLRGDTVLFQKLVGYEMELFTYDIVTSTQSAALTSGSGGGNRHGQITPDGDAIVFEAVVSGQQTAMQLDLATSTLTTLAAGTTGSRVPQTDGDDQVLLQSNVTGPEVMLADPALTTISMGSRGGHRLPSMDRHGQIFVWQQEHQNYLEVFALRRCWPAGVDHYGTAGTPSIGTLTAFETSYRCQQSIGVHTQLPANTLALYAVGLTQQNTPLPQAPGNTLLISALFSTFTISDAQGDVTAPLPLSPNLYGFTFYAQFGLLDAAANPFGVVASEGFEIEIR